MKITDIKVHLIQLEQEFSLPQYGTYKPEVGIVRVFTDEGIEGNADYSATGYPSKALAELILALKPLVIGEDPFNIELIWQRTYKSTRLIIPVYAAGCINVALWDIAGKALNQPIYRLLGGFRNRLRAYGSTHTYEDTKSFVKLCESLVERGFTAIKLHPWSEPDRDIELYRIIRKAVGDKIDLMTDPMGLYDRYNALRVGRVLEELNYYWYEEPLIEDDVEGYIELCRCLDTPVLGIDALRLSLGNYADYIARGALDIVQADAARLGISLARKIASVTEGFGRTFQAHAYGPPLHQAANLQLMGAISNGDLFEMPVPEGIMDTPVENPITLDKDGWVTIPEKPGLGLEIDWKKMGKLTKAVIE